MHSLLTLTQTVHEVTTVSEGLHRRSEKLLTPGVLFIYSRHYVTTLPAAQAIHCLVAWLVSNGAYKDVEEVVVA
jgi:hypothetical protein